MLALNTQTQGSNLSPVDWNGMLSEIQNAIEDTGITLDGSVLTQLGEAISNYMVRSTFYTGGGTAAAQTLTKLAGLESPNVYQNGMRVFWRPSNASTGATTISVNALGVVDLVQEDGTALIANDLVTTKDAEARYDSSSGDFFLIGA